MERGEDVPQAALTVALGLVSAVAIALQLVLIRLFSITSYHHFTYLVISIALLGFGASGTLLAVLRRYRGGIGRRWLFPALALLVVSTAWAFRISALIPLDIQYLPYSLREALDFLLIAVILFLPFFAAGFFIGLVLTSDRHNIGRLYGVNMVSSGVGGILAVGLLSLVPANIAPGWLALALLPSLLQSAWEGRDRRGPSKRTAARISLAAAIVALTALALLFPPQLRIDPYKEETFAIRLLEQGVAERIATEDGARGRLSVYRSASLHHTLFAALNAPLPPEQSLLFVDGTSAGAIFDIDSEAEAPILHSLPQSLPYRLRKPGRVLLLGESTGLNVWLALAHGAESVTVVQPNPELTGLLQTELVDHGGSVLGRPDVQVVNRSPRLFLEADGPEFDLIQFVSAEAMPAVSGGLASLQEDYLLTVEGVGAALGRLSEDGVLSVTRGLQTPPRDNIRVFALFSSALRHHGWTPRERILQARNYLASTTIASRSPLTGAEIRHIRGQAANLLMDIDYFPGMRPSNATEINRLAGETGGMSEYAAAASALTGDEWNQYLENSRFILRPPTDDRPYFHSFFRPRNIFRHIQEFGPDWFSSLELGSVVVVVTLAGVLVLGVLFITLPAVVSRTGVAGREKGPTSQPGPMIRQWSTTQVLVHFLLIGFGFMFVEMVSIQRLIRFLDDPLIAATAVLSAILVFAGLGSTLQARIRLPERFRIPAAALAVAVLAALHGEFADEILLLTVDAGAFARSLAGFLTLAPLAFMLGWLFPAGITHTPVAATPVAWAVNGVASVAAGPIAVLLAVFGGFRLLTIAAAACYLLVAVAALVQRQKTPIHSSSGDGDAPQSEP